MREFSMAAIACVVLNHECCHLASLSALLQRAHGCNRYAYWREWIMRRWKTCKSTRNKH